MDSKLKYRKKNQNVVNDEYSTIEIEETCESDSLKQTPNKSKQAKVVSYDQLRQMSREFHAKTPPNLYYREKIPYKTIIICVIFFIVGFIFLTLGLLKTIEQGFYNSYELLLLGSILFIPGSYHTFLAFMACRKVHGYSFAEVAVFDEDYNKEDE